MMAFTQLDEEQYDIIGSRITYLKLFQHIVKDFITRDDAKQMLDSNNFVVTVNSGQAVRVVVPAGTGSTTSPATGKVVPVYNGSFASPGTKILEQTLLIEKEGSKGQ